MSEAVKNIDYLSAFRVDIGGSKANCVAKIEEAIDINQSSLQATKASKGTGQTPSATLYADNTRHLWHITPNGAKGQVEVEIDPTTGEMIVSGNFSDILMLNKAISSATGQASGITVSA